MIDLWRTLVVELLFHLTIITLFVILLALFLSYLSNRYLYNTTVSNVLSFTASFLAIIATMFSFVAAFTSLLEAMFVEGIIFLVLMGFGFYTAVVVNKEK